MSRFCDYPETTTGHSCKNLVEPGHDHCAAGHPCPWSISSTSTPDKIPAKIADFTAETEELFGLDSTTMSQADALLVCSSDKSAGMDAEISFAEEHGIPVLGDHAVEPIGTSDNEDKPVLSRYVLQLKVEAKKARSEAMDLVTANIGSLDWKTSWKSLEAVRHKAEVMTDFAYGKQTEELLVDCLDLDSNTSLSETAGVWYEQTLHGPGFSLAIFLTSEIAGPENPTLVRGYIPGSQHKHWYVLAECETCNDPAYVRLKNEEDWYGEDRLTDAAARRALFTAAVDHAANAVAALCQEHRQKTASAALDT